MPIDADAQNVLLWCLCGRGFKIIRLSKIPFLLVNLTFLVLDTSDRRYFNECSFMVFLNWVGGSGRMSDR